MRAVSRRPKPRRILTRSETLSKGLDSKPKARLPKSNRCHFQEAGRKQLRREHYCGFHVARRAIITDISNNGIISVPHSWGSALMHHPHVHMIVPGGGLSEDGRKWIACRPNFFLSVRVLSRLFQRRVLQMLIAAHEAGRLQFFGAHAALADANVFAAFLAPR
jgi:hypothetical protein